MQANYGFQIPGWAPQINASVLVDDFGNEIWLELWPRCFWESPVRALDLAHYFIDSGLVH
ncbi:hypothetical protein C0Z20_00960 [Trinickia symbiotica]|uniref:Uncharacterized protein n=1 Tax=Trinickia symbiotica TaxID=863227 RepID=A0A2N7XAJ9_9BURK|nr:hypothetical protein C0Z20_00960 [Trinickia symbiotica]